MSEQYEGDPTAFPVDFTLPDDSAPPKAAILNPALEALGDRTAWLKSKVGQIAALTFHHTVGTTNSFSVLKYSPALRRFFGLSNSVDEYFASTNQLLVWPVVTEITGGLLLGNVTWDFDVGPDGTVVSIDSGIDNLKTRNPAGVWSSQSGGEGTGTTKPNVVYEPVSGNWIVAFQVGGGGPIVVQVSSDALVSFTAQGVVTPPSGFPVTAEVTLGVDPVSGRVVMQGFLGTDCYFAYSDDGGLTWSPGTTHALGFAYGQAASFHNPKPVKTDSGWVAVAAAAAPATTTRVFKSVDGITWTVAASLATVGISTIACIGSVVLGMTKLSTPIMTSDEGVTWRLGEGTYIFSAAAAKGVASTGTRFVLLAVDRIFPGLGVGEGGEVVT